MWRWLVVGLWLAATLASAAELRVTVRDARGQPLPEAVVMLESPQAARAVKPLMGVEMVQRDKTFIPQVLVVTRGTAVSFPNQDTVRHHVYSLSPAKPFEIKLFAGTPANPVVFDRAGVVLLGCNIHDHMVGWVVVADTPYHGLTDPKGTTRLAPVPAGAYSLVVWHPELPVGSNGVRRAVTLRDGAPVVVDMVLAEVGR